jgi:hypothetical protein
MPAKRTTGKKGAAAKVIGAGLAAMTGGPAAARSIVGDARSGRPYVFAPRRAKKGRGKRS